MDNFEQYDWCMRHKCKNCKVDNECEILNDTRRLRLMWHPFENLKEVLEKKNDTKNNSLRLARKR
jgi:hypothetical protein